MIGEFFQILSSSGIWVLFILVLLEGNPFIGSFIPGQVLVILAGVFMATSGETSFFFPFIIIAIGAFLGDLGGFFFGKKYGIGGLSMLGIKKSSPIFKSTQHFFNKTGPLSIVLGRQFNLTRSFMPFLAGISNMNTSKFIILSGISAILWSSISFYLGFSFGYIIVEKMKFLFTFVTFVIVYLIILNYIFRMIKKLTHQEKNTHRRYNLMNLLFVVVLVFFIIFGVLVKEFGFDLWFNSMFAFLIFPSLAVSFSFLFSKIFILFLLEGIFLYPIIQKKVKLFILFLWSFFFYLQFIFVISFLVKKFFQIHLLFSVFMYTFIFFLFLILCSNCSKKKVSNVSIFGKYFKFFLVTLIFFILIVKISLLKGSFYEILITFLIASLGCEILNLLSYFKILNSTLSSSIKKF